MVYAQSHILNLQGLNWFLVVNMQKNMQKYLVLVKLNTSKTLGFYNTLSEMQKNPSEGVTLYGSYNVFGSWDFAIWFEADSNESAVHFVGEKIRAIDGVMETITMPATPLKEWMM